MSEKICFIIGACGPAEIYIPPQRPSYIMACDGGMKLMGGVRPDLAVGDFDSLGYVPDDVDVLFHQPEKDDTDVMLAVKKGLEMGFKTFVLYGCMGGRIDHAYANYQVLAYIDSHGGRGYLAGDGWITTVISHCQLCLEGSAGENFSVFAMGGTAHGVSIDGAKYPLEGYDMSPDFPIGVSNEFLLGRARISVEKGSLLVMWQGQPRRFIDKL